MGGAHLEVVDSRFLGESDAGEAGLQLAMGPPLAINYTNTNLSYGPILRGQVSGQTPVDFDACLLGKKEKLNWE